MSSRYALNCVTICAVTQFSVTSPLLIRLCQSSTFLYKTDIVTSTLLRLFSIFTILCEHGTNHIWKVIQLGRWESSSILQWWSTASSQSTCSVGYKVYWLTSEVRDARRKRRRAERLWRTTKLTIHKEMYINMRNEVTKCVIAAKRLYFTSKIDSAVFSTKQLFKVSNELLRKSGTSI